MPVLSKEPSIWPNDLFSSEGDNITEEACWWVLHTRPRAEKSLVRRLLERRIRFFLPLHERRRRLQGRKVISYLPLFPSYVFLRGTDEERQTALRTNLIAHCLEVFDQNQLANDLKRIHLLIESGLPLRREEQLKPGYQAEITEGPLAGFRGKVLRHSSSRMKLIVEVCFLQQGASVEVDSSLVQPLE